MVQVNSFISFLEAKQLILVITGLLSQNLIEITWEALLMLKQINKWVSINRKDYNNWKRCWKAFNSKILDHAPKVKRIADREGDQCNALVVYMKTRMIDKVKENKNKNNS